MRLWKSYDYFQNGKVHENLRQNTGNPAYGKEAH